MTTIVEPRTAAPVPAAPAGTEAPASAAGPRAPRPPRDRSRSTMLAVALVAIVGGVIVAAIGFYGSYSALVDLGRAHGLSDGYARVFPLGVDAGICVFLALDLVLTWRRAPMPALRFFAHVLTGATVYFNGAAAGSDVVGAVMHGITPLMFVASVEAGRRLIVKAARLKDGTAGDGVPMSRWVLDPGRAWGMYRRMRLWGITSYAAAIKLEQEREVYRVLLDRKHGSWKKAPSDARLPFTLARYGLSVDEALARPQEAEEAERLREEQAAAAREASALEAEKRQIATEAERVRARGDLAKLRTQVDSETDVAETQARAARALAETNTAVEISRAERAATAAERAAEAEEQAEETVRTAALRRKAAEDNLTAEKKRRAAAEEAEVAAAKERRAADDRAAAVRAAAQEKQAARDLAAAERAAADELVAAAQARDLAARIELRAVAAEDEAGLSQRARSERKVARLILTEAGGDYKALPLKRIQELYGVSESAAGEWRKGAADLIAGGYALPSPE
ncbi:DUF2637 domain-containing protein [Streptomyces sp. NPDC059396]|uniref:DUF2637 domain-containing protein n=1 Tax=Streptomyces sp. NPDC059396 TaxID=3346819 RepID=UPI00367D1733